MKVVTDKEKNRLLNEFIEKILNELGTLYILTDEIIKMNKNINNICGE